MANDIYSSKAAIINIISPFLTKNASILYVIKKASGQLIEPNKKIDIETNRKPPVIGYLRQEVFICHENGQRFSRWSLL